MANQPAPPFDWEAQVLSPLNKVVWSVAGDSGSDRTDAVYGEADEVIRIADYYPNIAGGRIR